MKHVINATIHNDWGSANEPMFTVFTDRIEILSRGPIPHGQTIEGFFRGESIPVNARLSEIALQLHISEKTGRGVPLIISKYGRPAYEFREKSIVVSIPFNSIETDDHRHIFNIPNDLNETQKVILTEIRNNPNVTKAQLINIVKKGKTTVDKSLSTLKSIGIIERVGRLLEIELKSPRFSSGD